MFVALTAVSLPGNSKRKIIIQLLLYKKILGKWPFMAIVMIVFFSLDITAPDFLCFNRLTFSKGYENYNYKWKWMISWFSHKKINGNSNWMILQKALTPRWNAIYRWNAENS